MKKSIILLCAFGSSYISIAQTVTPNVIIPSELHLIPQSNNPKTETDDIQIKFQSANNSNNEQWIATRDIILGTEHFIKPNTEHLVTCFFDMPSDGYIDLDFHWGGSELHKELERELAILFFQSANVRYYCTVHDLDENHNISIKGIPCSAGSHYLDMQSNTLYVKSTVTVTMYKKE